MGYWTDQSKLDPNRGLIWGDQVADILDDALWQIVACFASDMGRLPTKEEILNGIRFSLGGPNGDLLGLPEPGDESAELSDDDMTELNRLYYPATGGDVSPSESRMVASRAMAKLLKRIQEPYDTHGAPPTEAREPEGGMPALSAGRAAAEIDEYLDNRVAEMDVARPDLIDGGTENNPVRLTESGLRALLRGYRRLLRQS